MTTEATAVSSASPVYQRCIWSQQGQGTLVMVGMNADMDATALLKADANPDANQQVLWRECSVGLPVVEA